MGYIKEHTSVSHKKVSVERSDDGKYAVIDSCGNEVVPWGKYSWISGFDSGLARVKIMSSGGKSLFGIINSEGQEVVEPIYDEIWNFTGKNMYSTKAFLNGSETRIFFSNLPGSTYYDPDEEEEEPDTTWDTYPTYDTEWNEYLEAERLYDSYMDGEYVGEDW